jgi:hypothetical protein
MTTIKIQPAFDPTLQPIGYALAAELLTLAPPGPELAAGPDLFGWELPAAAHTTETTAIDAATGRADPPQRARPTGATLPLPTA